MDVAPSPCVGHCQMAQDSSHCKGCFRTLEEITRWRDMDNASRQALLALLPARIKEASK